MGIISDRLKKQLKEFQFDFKSNSSDFKNFLKNTSISNGEIRSLLLPEKMSSLDIASKIKVPLKSNVLPQIDLSLTPYLVDPISLISDPFLDWIFLIAPTQSGKTVFLQAVVADSISQNPGTLLYVYPDENNGKAALKEKVIAMIKETPFLYKHVISDRFLNTNSITLDNMTIWPAWSGSLGTLSSKPAKIIVLDEIRLMKLLIGNESNAIKLANDRLTTFKLFGSAMAYGVSTPSIKGDLLYNQMEVDGTLTIRWNFRCPSCEKYFRPQFFHMLRDCSRKDVSLYCPHCKNKIEEGLHKTVINKDGAYGSKKHYGLKEMPPVKEQKKGHDRLVMRYCSMASPFRPLKVMVEEYYKTKHIIADYKNFWQCWLAEFWEDDISKSTEQTLKANINPNLLRGKVPDGTKFLTAGVDVADSGFYVSVWAWGNQIKHMIDSYFIECHKDKTNWRKTRGIIEKRLDSRKWDGWEVASWVIDIADGDRNTELRAALAEFPKCYKIRGASDVQVVNIVYREKLDYYSVRRSPYLEETDSFGDDDQVSFFSEPEPTFFTQFCNTKKIKEVNKRTGEIKVVWKKFAQDDYRAAVTYAFECLDFQFRGDFTLRDMVENDKFTYNPVIQKSKAKLFDEDSYYEDEEIPDNEMSPFDEIEGSWMDIQ